MIVVGSSWPSDIEIIELFLTNRMSDYRVLIAPHNVSESEIESLERTFPDSVRYSQADGNIDQSVMLIDNIGMLSSIYRYADFVIIGGAFRGALHNTLEAAVYGVPIFFGEHQNNQKFKEAIDLIKAGGAFAFKSSNHIDMIFSTLEEEQAYENACNSSKEFVVSKTGATDLVVSKIFELI